MYSPAEIAENVIEIGKKKTTIPPRRLFLLGIMAGIFIAFAAVAANTASSTVENASMAKLVSGLIFPLGLAMVLVAGSELFTGNCLITIPVLQGEVKLSAMLKNWVFVYIGNFIGGLFIAGAVYIGGQLDLFGGALAVTTIKTAAYKASLGFGSAVVLGMLCNILVCIAVWMSFGAKSVGGKIAGLFMPVMAFVLCGFEHSIANMYYIPAGLFALADPNYAAMAENAGVNTASLTWGNMFTHNLIPVTIGNIIGGAVIVSGMYWLIYLRKSRSTASK